MNVNDSPPEELAIREYVASELLYSDNGFDYPDEAFLVEEGIIDSMGVMGLVEFVQKRFRIVVEQREVIPEHFGSVARLAKFVRHKTLPLQRADDASSVRSEGN